MRNTVIVGAGRTPICRSRKGSFASVDAFALARAGVSGVLERSGVAAADVDDVMLAEALQGGGVIARHTAVSLGLSQVPGLALNRHCAGGQAAAQSAIAAIRADAI